MRDVTNYCSCIILPYTISFEYKCVITLAVIIKIFLVFNYGSRYDFWFAVDSKLNKKPTDWETRNLREFNVMLFENGR